MVSAYDKGEAKSLAKDIDIDHFIEKPVNQDKLYAYMLNVASNHKPNDVVKKRLKNLDLSEKRILLVEDNVVNRQVIMGLISDTGVNIDTALNGEDAINKKRHAAYDLIIMDAKMPIMDGPTAAKIMYQSMRVIPPIVLMDKVADGGQNLYNKWGIVATIDKPINASQLLSVLSKFLLVQPLIDPNESNTIIDAVDKSTTLVRLKNIPDLNPIKAIAWFQGKTQLYLELVEEFWRKNRSTLVEMVGLFKTQQLDLLRQNAHSIKSSAHYIGAFELSEAAGNLEVVLGSDNIAHEHQFYKVLKLLESILSQLDLIYRTPELMPSAVLNKEEALDLTARIRGLADMGAIEAEAVSQALLDICQNTQYANLAQQLHDLVSDFEFENAIKVSRKLTHNLQD